MGKPSPFEGELDRAGNPTCGQSFMAGTICTRAPGHEGRCAPWCQTCGGDWYEGTCACAGGGEGDGCEACGFEVAEGCSVCDDCRCPTERPDPRMGPFGRFEQCTLANGHLEDDQPHQFTPMRTRNDAPSEEELAEVYRSLGANPPK